MKKKTLKLLGIGLALSLGLVGCGSGGSGEAASAPTSASSSSASAEAAESGSEAESDAASSSASEAASASEASSESASSESEASGDSDAIYTGDPVTIKVGANITPHSEILEAAAPILAEQGITLEVVKLEDAITPNTGVIEGSLDANYFQHVPYLEQFNEENGSDLVQIGEAIHYEPFGVYAGKTSSLDELPDGALIAVPNNVTNEARSLLLLEQEGLLTLDENAGIEATIADITENPKNIQFKELAPEQLVQALPDVDVACINSNYAIEGGLHIKDALAVEADSGLAAQTYGNIVATSPDKLDDPALNALLTVLTSEEISEFIENTYDGAVVPLH